MGTALSASCKSLRSFRCSVSKVMPRTSLLLLLLLLRRLLGLGRPVQSRDEAERLFGVGLLHGLHLHGDGQLALGRALEDTAGRRHVEVVAPDGDAHVATAG